MSDNKFLGIFMIISGVLLFLFLFKVIFQVALLLLSIFLIIYGSKLAGYSDWYIKYSDLAKSKKKTLTEFFKRSNNGKE
jgi:hypothetical protein